MLYNHLARVKLYSVKKLLKLCYIYKLNVHELQCSQMSSLKIESEERTEELGI